MLSKKKEFFSFSLFPALLLEGGAMRGSSSIQEERGCAAALKIANSKHPSIYSLKVAGCNKNTGSMSLEAALCYLPLCPICCLLDKYAYRGSEGQGGKKTVIIVSSLGFMLSP